MSRRGWGNGMEERGLQVSGVVTRWVYCQARDMHRDQEPTRQSIQLSMYIRSSGI